MTEEFKDQKRWETLKNLSLAALSLGIVLAYGLNSGSFVFPKWLFFFLLAVSGGIALVAHILRCRTLSLDEVDAVALAFGGYSALSLLWSPDPGSGFVGLLNYTIAIAVFLWFRRISPERLKVVFPFIFLAASAVILLRIGMGEERYGGFGNESFVAEFLLLALPFVIVWWATRDTRERWLAPALTLAVLSYLLGFREYTFSKIIFVGGPALVISGALIAARPWLTQKRLMGIAIASVPIMAAFVAYGWQRPGTWVSLQTRFELTYNTLKMWLDEPLFGHGAGSFNYTYPRFMQSYQETFPAATFDTITEMLNYAGAAPNEPMQLLSDYGIVGLGFLVVFGLLLSKAISPFQNKSALNYAALVHLATAAIVSCLTFIFQNPATLFATVCALAIVLNRHNQRVTSDIPTRTFRLGWAGTLPIAASLVVVTVLTSTTMQRSYIAHWHFASATKLLLKDPPIAFDFNRRAYLAFPANPEPRRQLFITFMQWLESQQLGTGQTLPYDMAAQEEIYQISASTGPDAPGLMLPRIYHFILTNQHIERADEIERLFSDLKQRAPRLPDVYIVEALLSLKIQDYVRANRAVSQAERWVPTQSPELQKFQRAKVEALKLEVARETNSPPN